ncbi:agamous-like MADS-box protein AGL61 [Euphorbia lathyris]|uniref:agamous-like MADS-box protein AGL61 n=1 Tax=Euphorbia lathyris TaxID=212925 RepID=UPI003314169B
MKSVPWIKSLITKVSEYSFYALPQSFNNGQEKTTLGRQKIPIQKIQNKNHLQVTFSKRRSGLFKKASELCTLCGVEIAIIVFSPANKPFSFGFPEVDSILDRYLPLNPHFPTSNEGQIIKDCANAKVNDLNLELTKILNDLQTEKKRGEELDKLREFGQNMYPWQKPIDELGSDELNQLHHGLVQLKQKVELEINNIINQQSAPEPAPNPSGNWINNNINVQSAPAPAPAPAPNPSGNWFLDFQPAPAPAPNPSGNLIMDEQSAPAPAPAPAPTPPRNWIDFF